MNEVAAPEPGTSAEPTNAISTVLLTPRDVLNITNEFEKQKRHVYREQLLDDETDLIRKLSNMARLSNSTGNGLRKEAVDMIEEASICLQHAAFANRCIAAEQASVVFDILKKYRPPELKIKRPKLHPKSRKEKETPIIAKPEKPIKEKPCTSKAQLHPEPKQQKEQHQHKELKEPKEQQPQQQQVIEEPPEATIAANRGKRRQVTTPATEKPQEPKKKKENGSVKKRTSNRLSKTPRVSTKEDNEPTYCFCNRISFGDMIGCDNGKCEIEWFHFECIGLNTKPKGKWFCPDCRNPDSARMQKKTTPVSTKKDSNNKEPEV